jgi:hypothetical protein
VTGREPTIEGGAVPLPSHGTNARYVREVKRGTPCEACRAARRDYTYRYRARTSARCTPGLGWPLRVPPRARP